jgi:hypothetical protein
MQDLTAHRNVRGDLDAAFLDHASSLLRGAGYAACTGLPPEDARHAGVGAPSTHVTAPPRRLVDRFAAEICLAIKTKTDVPDWVLPALPDLPAIMRAADQHAHLADRAIVDATEASDQDGAVRSFLIPQRTCPTSYC